MGDNLVKIHMGTYEKGALSRGPQFKRRCELSEVLKVKASEALLNQELIAGCKMAFQIEKIHENNPELRKSSLVSSNITDDHSLRLAWTGQLSTELNRLPTLCSLGRRKAEQTSIEFGFEHNHFDLETDSVVTIMRPFGVQLNDENNIGQDESLDLVNFNNTYEEERNF